jgi:hypothetical protein
LPPPLVGNEIAVFKVEVNLLLHWCARFFWRTNARASGSSGIFDIKNSLYVRCREASTLV